MATGGGGGDTCGAPPSKLTCAICLETFRRPKLLHPCLHTFCQSCVQNVAGTAPSFPCPACRTIVLLPEGGVAALPNNFYVEQELGAGATAAAARLCDVCDEDRDAVYTCIQCRQRYCRACRKCHDAITSSRSHTVVPLQPDDAENLKVGQGGAGFDNDGEEKCPKHKTQPVILHCTACKANICMQCKLTSHEGHPTEDLSDTGNKAREKLRDVLKMLNDQSRKLQGVVEAVKQKSCELQTLQETTEQEVRQRTDALCQQAVECQDTALKTLQSLNSKVVATLADTKSRAQHKQAAGLTSRSEHVTRVLHENKDVEIVAFKEQLKDFKLDTDEVEQFLNEIESVTKPYSCEYNPTAVNAAQIQEYVGLLIKSDQKTKTQPDQGARILQSDGSASVDSQTGQSLAAVSSDAAVNPKMTFKTIKYSKNPKSDVVSICVTSEKRAWVLFKPSGEGIVTGLFDQNGLLQERHGVGDGCMITCRDDVTLCFGFCESPGKGWLIQPDRPRAVTFTDAWEGNQLFGVTKCASQNTFYGSDSQQIEENSVVLVSLNSTDPVKMSMTRVLSDTCIGSVLDVSQSDKYIVAKYDQGLKIFVKTGLDGNGWQFVSTYIITKGYDWQGLQLYSTVLDACFFQLDGREMLVVIFGNEHKLHVVDHTDGCRFVRYLDTGSCAVWNPQRLATDHISILWIACKGGKIMVVNVD